MITNPTVWSGDSPRQSSRNPMTHTQTTPDPTQPSGRVCVCVIALRIVCTVVLKLIDACTILCLRFEAVIAYVKHYRDVN